MEMTLIGARYTKWSINLIELTPVDDFQLETKPTHTPNAMRNKKCWTEIKTVRSTEQRQTEPIVARLESMKRNENVEKKQRNTDRWTYIGNRL